VTTFNVGLVPFDPKQDNRRSRAHEAHVSAILNSLLRHGYIVQTDIKEWILSGVQQGQAGSMGPPGPPGQAGSSWSSGTGTPFPSQGRLGDFYFQTETGQVWQKMSLFFGVPPTWVLIARLPPRGQRGLQGLPGPPGAPGAPASGGTSGAAGGAMTLVSTQNASTSATLQWTNLSGSYILTYDFLLSDTNAQNLTLQVGEGAGPTWKTTGSYQWAGVRVRGSTDLTGVAATNDSSISLSGENVSSAATGGVSGMARIPALQNTGSVKTIIADSGYFNGTGICRSSITGYWNGDTNAITGLRLLFTTGNILSGSASLYSIGQ
jgi:hypothetical protein